MLLSCRALRDLGCTLKFLPGSRFRWVPVAEAKSRLEAAVIEVVRRNLNRRLAELSRRLRFINLNITHSNRPGPSLPTAATSSSDSLLSPAALMTRSAANAESMPHPLFQTAPRSGLSVPFLGQFLIH